MLCDGFLEDWVIGRLILHSLGSNDGSRNVLLLLRLGKICAVGSAVLGITN
jgi:hypothetical protein